MGIVKTIRPYYDRRRRYVWLCLAWIAFLAMAGGSASAQGRYAQPHGRLVEATRIPDVVGRASVFRILYRSMTSRNVPINVSGLVVIPDSPAPAEGRPVVSWGHGTTGVAINCAPSLDVSMAFAALPGLSMLLQKGYIVVATDYPGLGTPGVHPYLDGISAARSMIDAVRAVRELTEARASTRYAAWGFSQGGHGALFVASIARSYAPELTLVGSAAASAPTQLNRLLRADAKTPAGRVIAAYAVWSWQHFYQAPVAEIADTKALSVISTIARVCSLNPLDDLELRARQPSVSAQRLLTDRAKPGHCVGAADHSE